MVKKFNEEWENGNGRFSEDDTIQKSPFLVALHKAIYDSIETREPITDSKIKMIDRLTRDVAKMLLDSNYVTDNMITVKDLGLI